MVALRASRRWDQRLNWILNNGHRWINVSFNSTKDRSILFLFALIEILIASKLLIVLLVFAGFLGTILNLRGTGQLSAIVLLFLTNSLAYELPVIVTFVEFVFLIVPSGEKCWALQISCPTHAWHTSALSFFFAASIIVVIVVLSYECGIEIVCLTHLGLVRAYNGVLSLPIVCGATKLFYLTKK